MKIISFSNTDWYAYNYRVPIDKLLKEEGVETVYVTPPGDMGFSKKIQEEGFEWIPLEMSRSGLNPMKEWEVITNLTKIYQAVKPDLVHHFTIKPNIYGNIAARRAKINHVVDSIAGLGYVFASPDLKARILRPFAYQGYGWAMSKSKVIFQNSEDLENFIKRKYTKKENSYLIRSSGVDLEKFDFTPLPNIEQINVVLGSRMLWTKGIGEFVEAAESIRKTNPNVNFLLVGDTDKGNPASINEKQLKEWHNKGIVEWLGFRNDMPDIIKKSHIVCFPSKHTEGTPKFLIEGAAIGRAIVTTLNRGCREVIEEQGKNGIMVEKGNSKQLAEALQQLIDNPDLCKKMGENGRQFIEKHFSIQHVAKNTLEVYRKPFVK